MIGPVCLCFGVVNERQLAGAPVEHFRGKNERISVFRMYHWLSGGWAVEWRERPKALIEGRLRAGNWISRVERRIVLNWGCAWLVANPEVTI